MELCYRVTFTKDGHKQRRNRKFLDGFVTQSGRDIRLMDESGGVVALGRLSDGSPLEPGAELEKGFGQGIIVHVDEPCAACEIGGDAGSDAAAPAAPTAASVAAAAPAWKGLPPAVTGRAGSRTVGSRPTFKAPRPVHAAAALGAEHQPAQEGAASAPQRGGSAAAVQPLQRRAFQAPPGLPWQPQAAAQPPAHALASSAALASGGCSPSLARFVEERKPDCVRSMQEPFKADCSPAADEDILAMLTGQAPLERRPLGDATATAPTAKRARIQPGTGPSPSAGLVAPAGPQPTSEALAQAKHTARWSSFLRDDDGGSGGASLGGRAPLLAAEAGPPGDSAQHPLQQGAPGGARPSAWRGAVAAQPPWGREAELDAVPEPPIGRPGNLPNLGHPEQAGQPSDQPARPSGRRPLQPIRRPPNGGGQPPGGLLGKQLLPGPGAPQRPPPSHPPSLWNVSVDGAVQLGWPGPEEAARPARRVQVPDSFPGAQQYVQIWCNALHEELNLRIAEVSQAFHAAMARVDELQRQPGPPYGGGGLEAHLRRARVPYYGSCELTVWRNNFAKKGGWKGGKRGRRGSEDEDGCGGEEEAEAKPDTFYLILKSGREKAAEYRRDDLWLLSSTPDFRPSLGPGQPGDRTRQPWTAVARSLWHGPNQDGKFEVAFLSPVPHGLGRSQAVYAIKGPDASTELGMVDLLRSGAAATLPLLPNLLRAGVTGTGGRPDGSMRRSGFIPPGAAAKSAEPGPAQDAAVAAAAPPVRPAAASGSPSYSCSDSDSAVPVAAAEAEVPPDSLSMLAERLAAEFALNEEQRRVLAHVAGWAGGIGGFPPVCLVHGPFGSGKSTLLVALLRFVLVQRSVPGSRLAGARVLVCAHTNVAVDRVLVGLADSGCTDFLRVGPLRRLSRRLLPHSLHASESRASAGAAAELQEMLKEASGPAEAAAIRAELAAVGKGADRQRKRLLRTVPVVGVTACSSRLSALDGQRFDLLVLDESSQMVEPLSVVPLLRCQARFLLAAGDPLQLPPVVAAPPHVTAASGAPSGQGPPHGLLRPLFVRLAALGVPPYLLRRQYRCHPDISAVPNSHFYGGRLLDGCSREARASLVPGLPSLALLDVRGQESYGAGRSASNQAEAEAVVAAVERLALAGVAPSRCGVITFFRAQAALVRSLLEPRAERLEQLAGQAARQLRRGRPFGGDGSSAAVGGTQEEGGAGEEEEALRDEQVPRSLQVATVDSFQGAECDVVLLTTVVTRPGAFASDACRLNVALTRARHNLLVVGCAAALQRSSPALAALLARCRAAPGGYHLGGRLPPSMQPSCEPVVPGGGGGGDEGEDDAEGWEAARAHR